MLKTRLTLLTAAVLLPFTLIGTAAAGQVSQAQTKLFQVQLQLARSGDPNGEYYVGEMYQDGLGTPRDLHKAHQWYERAAHKGNPEAQLRLENWNTILQTIATEKQAKAAAAREAVQTQAAARARIEAKARAEALAKKRAAAALAERRAQAAAAARKLARERAAAQAEARAQAVAMRKRKFAADKARAEAEARKRAQALAAAKAHAERAAAAHAAKAAPAKTPPPKAPSHTHGFSTNPCKGPTAKFLSTCSG